MRVPETKPDVVLIAADAPEFQKVRNLLESAGLRASLLYGGADVGAEELPGGQGDVITATVFARDELTERGQAFLKRYEEHFREPPDLIAVQGYDAVRAFSWTPWPGPIRPQPIRSGIKSRRRETSRA